MPLCESSLSVSFSHITSLVKNGVNSINVSVSFFFALTSHLMRAVPFSVVPRSVALPLIRGLFNFTFQQYNVLLHVFSIFRIFLDAENFHLLPWPAFSSDISLIECMWSIGYWVTGSFPYVNLYSILSIHNLSNIILNWWFTTYFST